jgi:hypothetical protein
MRSPLLRAIAPLVVAWTVGACGGTPTPAQPPADAPPVVGARPLPPAAALGSSEPPIPSSCAGRALLRADLEARGAGPRHPDLLRLEAAERPCDADRARTVEACVEVHRRVGELEASGLGPAHPTRVRLGAQLALCDTWKLFAPPPPLGPEEPPPPADAAIATKPWEDLVAVLRRDGYQNVSSGMADTGFERHHAQAKKGSRTLTMMALDFPADDDRRRTRVGRAQTLFVETFRKGLTDPRPRAATDVLEALIGRGRLGVVGRDELSRAAGRAGFEDLLSAATGYALVAGVERVRGQLNDSTTHAELLLVTYLDARAEGRVLIDDHRVLIVSACDPCPTGRMVGHDDLPSPAGTWDAGEAARITAAIAAAAGR